MIVELIDYGTNLFHLNRYKIQSPCRKDKYHDGKVKKFNRTIENNIRYVSLTLEDVMILEHKIEQKGC